VDPGREPVLIWDYGNIASEGRLQVKAPET
jgi:hypothetical protein